jgi:GT2 family glycosyltransferase
MYFRRTNSALRQRDHALNLRTMDGETLTCALVIIGRNEGERLKRCLRSLPTGLVRVYVDSGSTDGSQDFARVLGIAVVDLDSTQEFTAARARNAGLAVVRQAAEVPDFVQMIDGDCELDAGWITAALAALRAEPDLAVVFGRRRERFPERSLYNRQCDDEWNVPIGDAASCGGDAMVRLSALSAVGDYSADLIAGEEPDLCLRLAQHGWKIKRIDAEMTLHDADLRHFAQWWRRARRSGHAYAEHVWRHGAAALPSWRRQVWSIALWGLAIPICALALLSAWALGAPTLWAAALLFAVYPLQILRIAARTRKGLGYAALIVIGKFAELGGAARFYMNHARGYAPKLIEYKQPA